MGKTLRLFSPQAAKTYKELLKTPGPATAQSLGYRLGIFPHSVYRAAQELEEHGLIERFNGRPVRFKAAVPTDVVDRLLLSYREWFLKTFSLKTQKQVDVRDDFGVSFIHSRDESIHRSTKDLQDAKKEYLLIISGNEIPPETMLAMKQTVQRGVVVKTIVQCVNKENQQMLKNWQKNGIAIRISQTILTRITIVDSEVVYLISYDPENYTISFGVRFHYPPIANLIRQMFIQKWKEAKPL